MTTASGALVLNKLKSLTKTLRQSFWRIPAANPPPNTTQEWDQYFGSYCRCRDSLTWSNLDGTVAQAECSTLPINVARAVKSSIVANPTTAYILCIDEGVQDLYANHKNISLCIPGCGILMPELKEDLASTIAQTVRQIGISRVVVTSHADCGAAGIAAEQEFEKIKQHHTNTFFKSLIEIVAEDYAKSMADLLKTELQTTNVKVEVLHIKKLDRPKFHHAFGAILNFVPRLNIGLLEEKLGVPMFGISANLLDDQTARRDTVLAYKIASGVDGFTNKFTTEDPFEVIACVDNDLDIERTRTIFSNMPSDLPIKYTLVNTNAM